MSLLFKKLILSFGPWICWLYIQTVGITSRIRCVGHAERDRLKREGKPFLYAFWHGRQFFLAYLGKEENLRVLISKSRDGEMIARTVARFGIEAVRGSSSKGGASALAQMLKTLQSQTKLGITPDGPRGPDREVHPGVLHLSQKTGYPIIPVSFDARRKKVFKSWDSFILPYPLNDIVVTFGAPVFIAESDSLELAGKKLKQALDETTNLGTLFLKGNIRAGIF